jgi:hypothetical protein
MVPAARVRLNAIAANTSHAPLDAKFPDVIWSLPTDVHDVGDEGCCPSGSRRGCGYLASSITTTKGCRCGFNAFSCRAQEQSPGRCSMTSILWSNRSSGSWGTWLRSSGHRKQLQLHTRRSASGSLRSVHFMERGRNVPTASTRERHPVQMISGLGRSPAQNFWSLVVPPADTLRTTGVASTTGAINPTGRPFNRSGGAVRLSADRQPWNLLVPYELSPCPGAPARTGR